MSPAGHHDVRADGPVRPTRTREVVTALAAVAPPARDRDAAAEAAAVVRWAGARDADGALTADLDTPAAASRLVSLLTRLGAADGTVRGDAARGRWRVQVGPDSGSGDPLAVRLGIVDRRGRPLPAPPAWLTGGSLPGAVATWRGALLARGGVSDGAVTVECPGPAAALALAELGLRLGVRAGRPGPCRLTVADPAEVALLLTTCGSRATAAVAGFAEEEDPAARGSANDARATVAASRAAATVAEAFATLQRAGTDVPDPLAEVGRLRLAHPELGLPELAARADPPLSKDALAGRLRRLVALAARHR